MLMEVSEQLSGIGSPTVWVLGILLRLSDLVASTLTRETILLVLCFCLRHSEAFYKAVSENTVFIFLIILLSTYERTLLGRSTSAKADGWELHSVWNVLGRGPNYKFSWDVFGPFKWLFIFCLGVGPNTLWLLGKSFGMLPPTQKLRVSSVRHLTGPLPCCDHLPNAAINVFKK